MGQGIPPRQTSKSGSEWSLLRMDGCIEWYTTRKCPGPILFVLYINDLPENVKSEVFMFADDTKVYRKITSEKDQQQLQIDLKQMQS